MQNLNNGTDVHAEEPGATPDIHIINEQSASVDALIGLEACER